MLLLHQLSEKYEQDPIPFINNFHVYINTSAVVNHLRDETLKELLQIYALR